MNLYEIDSAIMACVDAETGEIIDEEKLAELQLAFDVKIEGIACWIKDLLAEAKAIKEEKDNLNTRQKVCENKAESLKRYLSGALNGEKFKTPKVSISYRKSETVEISDMTKINAEYLKFPEPTVDKTKIKQAIKSGIDLDGANIVEHTNIQIK